MIIYVGAAVMLIEIYIVLSKMCLLICTLPVIKREAWDLHNGVRRVSTCGAAFGPVINGVRIWHGN